MKKYCDNCDKLVDLTDSGYCNECGKHADNMRVFKEYKLTTFVELIDEVYIDGEAIIEEEILKNLNEISDYYHLKFAKKYK